MELVDLMSYKADNPLSQHTPLCMIKYQELVEKHHVGLCLKQLKTIILTLHFIKHSA